MSRLMLAVSSFHGRIGTVPFVLLVLLALYALYVIKMHLGIDIFPNWGLHLWGPRTLLRWLAAKIW
jgi:hypothetical protein